MESVKVSKVVRIKGSDIRSTVIVGPVQDTIMALGGTSLTVIIKTKEKSVYVDLPIELVRQMMELVRAGL